jgi:multiple sugar transport system permease protein
MSATATVSRPAGQESSRLKVVRRHPRGRTPTHRPITGLTLVAPAVLFAVAFVLVPLVFAIYISLTDWPLIGKYHFVGFQNYAQIGDDQTFWHATVYTLTYTAIVTVPILLIGYAMAVFVRENKRGATFFRTIFFLPYVIGLSTLSFLALLELQPGSGAINAVLHGLHITDGQTAWLVNTVPGTAAICVLVVWAVSGLTMMLIMAGMQGIPSDVYESAELDGAGWWDRELRITVPMLRRTIAMSLILSIIGSFLAFNQFYILTQGGPGTSTTTVVMWIYERAFVQLHLGSATALSIVLIVVVALVSAAQFRLLRVKDDK